MKKDGAVEGEHHLPTLSGEKTTCARTLLTATSPEYSNAMTIYWDGVLSYTEDSTLINLVIF